VMSGGCFILQKGQTTPVFRVDFVAQMRQQIID
jgi:hypothetical protein